MIKHILILTLLLVSCTTENIAESEHPVVTLTETVTAVAIAGGSVETNDYVKGCIVERLRVGHYLVTLDEPVALPETPEDPFPIISASSTSFGPIYVDAVL